jgi:Na+/glutamate symporter
MKETQVTQPTSDKLNQAAGRQAKVYWKIGVLCIVSGLGNTLLSYLVSGFAKIPLYMDTVFTVAVCFAAGLLPGIFAMLVSFVYTPFSFKYLLGYPAEAFWLPSAFSVCIIVELLLVWFFHKKMKEREADFFAKPSLDLFIGIAVHLLTLVALDCIAISITGGITDFVLTRFSAPTVPSPEDTFKFGLLRNNVPLLATAILSRIPINIVDRFFVIFGGYGISVLYRKWLRGPHADLIPQ